MIDILNPPREIFLGYNTENEFRLQQFDVSEWLKIHPNGIVSLLFKRPDGKFYNVIEGCSSSPMDWLPTTDDLKVEGSGSLVAVIVDGTTIGKSPTIGTKTGHTEASSMSAPDPSVPDWVVESVTLKKATQESQLSAEEAKDAAILAKTEAEAARDSAIEAEAGSEAARTGILEAKIAAESARDSSVAASIYSDQRATAAATSASDALSEANAASLHQDSAAQSKVTALSAADDATQASIAALAQAQVAEQAAVAAQAALASFPTRYYKVSVDAMDAITGMKQGDLCYVLDLVNSVTTLYTWDTVDTDADEVNPEWMRIGVMKFELMSRSDLLSILQLATVALTGNYSDLNGKPLRYEGFAVLDPVDSTVTWDYSVSDKIKTTLIADSALTVSNTTNGSIGLIEVYGGFELTVTGSKSADWDYMTLTTGQHWVYMFMYNGTTYNWTRTVCNE